MAQERTVIVTGGTRGIGFTIAARFLEKGYCVYVCGRNTPHSLPEAHGLGAKFRSVDLTDPEAAEAFINEVVAESGSLDVLINNAGGSPYCEADKASTRFSESITKLNLLAPLWMCQFANSHMQTQREGGAIVNIASVSGIRASPGTAAYGAAKAGLLNLTKSLGVEWAPKVRVNAVVAGLIETELSHLHYGDAKAMDAVRKTVPMQRMGSPLDIAEACCFLASDASSYMSGASITLDGGGEEPAFLTAFKRAQSDSTGLKE